MAERGAAGRRGDRDPRSITATPDGYVAVGSGCCPDRAAVWLSSDGLAWERLPDQPGFADTAMLGVTWQDDRLVAVGCSAQLECFGGLSWTSSDGRTWSQPVALDLMPVAVSATAAGAMAVGSSEPYEGSAALAVSVDGAAWSASSIIAPSGSLDAAIDAPVGILAVGGTTDPRNGRAATLAFTSPDGLAWEPLEGEGLEGVWVEDVTRHPWWLAAHGLEHEACRPGAGDPVDDGPGDLQRHPLPARDEGGWLTSRRSRGIRRHDHGGRRLDHPQPWRGAHRLGQGRQRGRHDRLNAWAWPFGPLPGAAASPGRSSPRSVTALRVTDAPRAHGTAASEPLTGKRSQDLAARRADRSLSGPALLAAWAAARGSRAIPASRVMLGSARAITLDTARRPTARRSLAGTADALAAGDTAPRPAILRPAPGPGCREGRCHGTIGGRRLEAGHDLASDRMLQQLLDPVHELLLVSRHERGGHALLPGTAGPADAVDVVLRARWAARS